MSIVPFRRTERRRTRRPLDQAQVVRAALELLDDAGLDALTMRRLAGRLGVKAASLHLATDAQDALFQFGIEMCVRGVGSLARRDA